ncbi:HAMP domain-containing sensor histidine kinase [Paenibacillus bouchesdurhonensis]|uniref:HAMP domain-containing sensor histidine kinase n=1 Tax=Paenibacillus bouchesdurhonensis TaxID=1870990 RepID=UPI000DA5F9AE|nr:HAMP domain-containing sensor histidine kinase [Paenibacillus bouchesdurhonensis]
MRHKTLKRDFYLLVVKVVSFTIVSTIVAYLLLVIFLFSDTAKPTDYYVKYFNIIERMVENNPEGVLLGELPDLTGMSDQIKSEVLDTSGHHLYGELGIGNPSVDLWKNLNKEIVRNNYVYRYIPIVKDDALQGVYLLKAPFGYVVNNYKDQPVSVFLYIALIMSPIFFFMLYLVLFTKQLYEKMSRNITSLLQGAEHISTGDFDFRINELEGKEFNVIQQSFNGMVSSLKEADLALQKMELERSMMVQSIAHDIRTPITVIKGQLELITQLQNSSAFTFDAFKQTIDSNCNKMINLTNNLAVLYKVEKVDFMLHPEQVHLEDTLLEKKKEFSAMAQLKGISIRFEIQLTKLVYWIDEAMLIRVLDNILYNSLRFTSHGVIKLEVHDDPEKNRIHFCCTDTGMGFKQQDTKALFEAMYQEDYYKDHFGLGLYIAKRIVSNFKGEIRASNSPQGGAVIQFYIEEC